MRVYDHVYFSQKGFRRVIIWSFCNSMKRPITLYCYQIFPCSVYLFVNGKLIVGNPFLLLDSSASVLFFLWLFLQGFFLSFISTCTLTSFWFYYLLFHSSFFPRNFFLVFTTFSLFPSLSRYFFVALDALFFPSFSFLFFFLSFFFRSVGVIN